MYKRQEHEHKKRQTAQKNKGVPLKARGGVSQGLGRTIEKVKIVLIGWTHGTVTSKKHGEPRFLLLKIAIILKMISREKLKLRQQQQQRFHVSHKE